MALLWELGPDRWFGFPLSTRLFVPTSACPRVWLFQTKSELAQQLLKSFRWPASRVIFMVDNLYVKAKLATNLGLQGALAPGEFVAPSFLRDFKPSVVIIVNRIYRKEIGSDLLNVRLKPRVITLKKLL